MSREKIAQKLQMEVWEVVTTHAQVYEHGEHILELLFNYFQLSCQKLLKKLLKVAKLHNATFTFFCNFSPIWSNGIPIISKLTTNLTYGKNLTLNLHRPYWPHDVIIIMYCANQRVILSLKRGDIVWQQRHCPKKPYPSFAYVVEKPNGYPNL